MLKRKCPEGPIRKRQIPQFEVVGRRNQTISIEENRKKRNPILAAIEPTAEQSCFVNRRDKAQIRQPSTIVTRIQKKYMQLNYMKKSMTFRLLS
jgi:hypothetical protein